WDVCGICHNTLYLFPSRHPPHIRDCAACGEYAVCSTRHFVSYCPDCEQYDICKKTHGHTCPVCKQWTCATHDHFEDMGRLPMRIDPSLEAGEKFVEIDCLYCGEQTWTIPDRLILKYDVYGVYHQWEDIWHGDDGVCRQCGDIWHGDDGVCRQCGDKHVWRGVDGYVYCEDCHHYRCSKFMQICKYE
ncbi:unnamed protein product, partial [marine sediment metagenome]